VKSKVEIEAKEILGKKVLILGEVGSGKTLRASRFIQELIKVVGLKEITVIDLAPPRKGVVGGKITDYVNLTKYVRYLSPKKVYMPRLAAKTPKELLHYTDLNKKNMEPLFKEFINQPSKVLFVNDITLYLHRGDLETIIRCARLAETFLATAYYGFRLARDQGTGISAREKRLTNELAKLMDLIIQTS
jgi:predicted NACHT family NTPase